MSEAPGRVIIATFSSLISRIQQVIDAAGKYDRRVCVIGRNMTEIVRMATELGYLKAPGHILAQIDELKGLPHTGRAYFRAGAHRQPRP